jgi:hypothetical protein
MGRDSVAGIATRYGLDSPGIKSRKGRNFPHTSRPVLGPTQPLIRLGIGSLFRGLKRPGRSLNHSPPHSARLKEEYSYTSILPLGLHGLF